MHALKNIFLKDSNIAFDKFHRRTISFNIDRYNETVERGNRNYRNMELAIKRASYIKSKVVANLAGYLEEFEKNAIRNGMEVLWVRNGKEAIDEITRILNEEKARVVVKSKSMISEEIELNENIEKAGAEPIETDLGEFIVQQAGEKPYHILTPAMHKSKEDVALLFHEKFGTPSDATPEEITIFVRNQLRHKFQTAEVGITGANFLIADTGSVSLTENEGNGLMSTAFPKVHVVITGIEKVLPSINDLPLFLQLLAAKGTGQQLTVYNSLFSGPKKKDETNGPEKMVVILLDNKRSELARENEINQSLKCIRCGACLNACPVYKNIGGYVYNTTYSGPIGSVVTPYMKSFSAFNHLSYASTVCGACSEVCPVKIPLHHLLLLNRKKSVEKNQDNFSLNFAMKSWQITASKRRNMDAVNGNVKNKIFKLNRNILGDQKEVPSFAKKSFGKIWKSSNLK